jgi:hypothetical protein
MKIKACFLVHIFNINFNLSCFLINYVSWKLQIVLSQYDMYAKEW